MGTGNWNVLILVIPIPEDAPRNSRKQKWLSFSVILNILFPGNGSDDSQDQLPKWLIYINQNSQDYLFPEMSSEFPSPILSSQKYSTTVEYDTFSSKYFNLPFSRTEHFLRYLPPLGKFGYKLLSIMEKRWVEAPPKKKYSSLSHRNADEISAITISSVNLNFKQRLFFIRWKLFDVSNDNRQWFHYSKFEKKKLNLTSF